jgi:DNA-binding HTH domain-containing proteins
MFCYMNTFRDIHTRRNAALYSTAGVALFFCAWNLGVADVALNLGYAKSGRWIAIIHFCCTLAAGVALSIWLRKPAPEKRLPVLIPGLLVSFLAVGHFVLPLLGVPGFLSLLPGTTLGLFLPLGLLLLFRSVPPGRHGFVLGMALAAGELVWVSLLPFLTLGVSLSQGAEARWYIHSVQGGLLLCVPLCLWLALRGEERPGSPVAVPSAPSLREDTPARDASSSDRALAILFFVFILFFTLFGLAMNVVFPRTVPQSELPELWHAWVLFTTPAAGLLLDKGLTGGAPGSGGVFTFGRSLRILLGGTALGVLFVPALTVIGTAGSGSCTDGLVALLFIIRLILFVILVVFAARFARLGMFPLVGSLAHSLYLAQFFGVLIGKSAIPSFPAACVLALAVVAGLWRFYAFLAANRNLVETPSGNTGVSVPGELPQPEDGACSPEEAKLAAFTYAFGLTRREREVLSCIIRRLPPESMGKILGISESTVRFHQTKLFRKTNSPNRRRLFLFYASWNPDNPG